MARMNPERVVGRFAPTPSGDLHLGTLVAALGSWLHARRQGGSWLVRIDDIDPLREVPGSAAAILAGLARCGLEPDAPPLYQSTRGPAYAAALAALEAQGLVFPCWCSRRELELAEGIHRDGRCLHPPDPERSPALRLRTPPGVIRFHDGFCGEIAEDVRASVGDFVLRRADGCWSYHLACAVDEAYLGVSEVVRGRDLLASTARQILLLRLLDLPVPHYAHLPLVLDERGVKLSKSARTAALDLGDPCAALRRALAPLGLGPAASLDTTEGILAWALEAWQPPPAGWPGSVITDEAGA